MDQQDNRLDDISDRNVRSFALPSGPANSMSESSYYKYRTGSVEIQANELPSEWQIRSRWGWRRQKSITWRIGLVAALAAALPFILTFSIYFLNTQSVAVPMQLNLLSEFFNNPWVSGPMGIFAAVFGISIVIRTWRFVDRRLLEGSRFLKQVWIGGGTTWIGLGSRGISVHSNRAMYALDWAFIERAIPSYLPESIREKKEARGARVFTPPESALSLYLKRVGSKGARDVLVIPKRFFNDQSQISWDDFVTFANEQVNSTP